MDFINPSKQQQNKLLLITGYFLVGIAVVLMTIVLVFVAYGYRRGANGQIIQDGLVFVSSNPNPAQIYLNGRLISQTTNSRLQLPAGQYTMQLKRAGYRPWVRSLGVEGGSVEHFDYPFLFPTNLVTSVIQSYASQPNLVLQSPDRHWLLVEDPANPSNFTEYDLSKPKQLAKNQQTISLPASIITTGKGGDSWQLVDWSTDSRHAILKHGFNGGSEYILLDRQTPIDSVNLTNQLSLSPSVQISFDNNKYNQYYLWDSSGDTLSTVTLSSPSPVSVLDHVLAFNTYGSNVILYATDKNAAAGLVNIDVLQGSTNSVLRTEPAGSTYLLDITQYSGNWYVVAGATVDPKVYIYENPMAAVQGQPSQPLVPVYILKVPSPTYVAFSTNAQFIVAEGGQTFGVYDNENTKGYGYTIEQPVAASQHATWMDGDRLMLVSGVKINIFDYDDANPQTLQPAVEGTVPLFDPSFKWSYVVAPTPAAASQAAGFALTSTALRIPADQ